MYHFVHVLVVIIVFLYIVCFLLLFNPINHGYTTTKEFENSRTAIPKKFEFTERNTFVINLETSIERLKNIDKRLTHFNIKYTRWNASTPDTVTDVFAKKYITDTEKGCAQSHIHIWRHIVKNNIDYALILEDDAVFDKQWLEKLQLFCDTVEDDLWDGVFMDISEPIYPIHTWGIVKPGWCTGGYILSKKGATTLLKTFKNKYSIADFMTRRLQEYNHSYSYFPYLIIQEGISSTISENNNSNNNKNTYTTLKSINYSLNNYLYT